MTRGVRNLFPDDLCKRCGRCCREKVWFEDWLYALPVYCRHWDPATGLCARYEDRFDLEDVECLPVAEGINRQALPGDCPYVADLDGYQPPREDWDSCQELVEMFMAGEIP